MIYMPLPVQMKLVDDVIYKQARHHRLLEGFDRTIHYLINENIQPISKQHVPLLKF